MIFYCQSMKHPSCTNGNGYYYWDRIPQFCPSCGDPWITKSEANWGLKQKAIDWAFKSKQDNNDIKLRYYTDADLLAIYNMYREDDKDKAALASMYLELRSHVRDLADYEWMPPGYQHKGYYDSVVLSCHHVAGQITSAIKYIDFMARGIDHRANSKWVWIPTGYPGNMTIAPTSRLPYEVTTKSKSLVRSVWDMIFKKKESLI